MKTCPFCSAENDVLDKYCRHCGQPLDSLVLVADRNVESGAKTVQLRQTASAETRRTVPLAKLFSDHAHLIVGRAPDCDICLQHPSVSRYHALFVRVPAGVQVSDLNSINGVLVNGRRLTEPVLVGEKQIIGIGPFLFTMLGDSLQSLDSSRSLRLEAHGLEKVVQGYDGKPKKLLDDVNLVVHPGEFVSLLGPSGSGKSTLMDCLNGRRRATGGKVLANGEDFYQHFDNFRQLLGYVPQKDIVHNGLTVHRALYYTALLRLPTDTDRTEIEARVEDVLREMELLPHRDTLIANLSGGQVKRVSLGAELLARPCLLYIDEATSGLDAGTESRMMRLFRTLSDEGRSILCITHNIENVDQCHLTLILSRGRLLFIGPPAEAPTYFGVRRLGEIYDKLDERTPEEWEKQFRESSQFGDYVAKRLVEARGAPEAAREETPSRLIESTAALPSKSPLLAQRMHTAFSRGMGLAAELLQPVSEHWHQFKVLTRRYWKLTWSDRRSLRLLFLQAPIVALFLLIGFVNKPYQGKIPATRKLTEVERLAIRNLNAVLLPSGLKEEDRKTLDGIRVPSPDGADTITMGQAFSTMDELKLVKLMRFLEETDEAVVPDEPIVNPAYTFLLLSIVVIAVLWFGCNNAAKEIVKEEAIYTRERAVNLRIGPYLGSKFVVLAVLSAIQVVMFMAVLFGIIEALHLIDERFQTPPTLYRIDYPTMYCILVLLALTGTALGLMLSSCVSSPDRASTLLPYVLIPQMILGGGIIAIRGGVLYLLATTLSPVYWAFRAVRLGECDLPKDDYYRMSYDDRLWIPCTALLVQTVVMLMLTAWFLKRKDAR